MNRHQLTSITVATACFVAVGIAATTLASTVSSDPAEAVDLNYQYLPIESNDVAQFQEDIQTNEPAPDQPPSVDPPDSASGSGIDPSDLDAGSEDLPDIENSDAGPETGLRPDGDGSESMAAGGEAQSDSSSGFPERLAVLLAVVLLAAVLLALLGFWYRDRLRSLFGSTDDTLEETRSDEGWEPPRPAEHNVVFDAWWALLNRLDGHPHARTTGECATAATAAGMDPDAVATLTRTFEEVRYGQRPVTPDRREQVTQVCHRLSLDVPEADP